MRAIVGWMLCSCLMLYPMILRAPGVVDRVKFEVVEGVNRESAATGRRGHPHLVLRGGLEDKIAGGSSRGEARIMCGGHSRDLPDPSTSSRFAAPHVLSLITNVARGAGWSGLSVLLPLADAEEPGLSQRPPLQGPE